MTISGHLKGIVSHKILNIVSYMYILTYLTRDFSLPLAIEMYGWPFVSGHPYIESTSMLSDYTYIKLLPKNPVTKSLL